MLRCERKSSSKSTRGRCAHLVGQVQCPPALCLVGFSRSGRFLERGATRLVDTLMLRRTRLIAICFALGVAVSACGADSTETIAGKLVPYRFGRLDAVETVSDSNCFATAFRTKFAGGLPQDGAPAGGDISRGRNPLSTLGSQVTYSS